MDNPQPPLEMADHLTVGIDGGFVKAKCDPQARRRHFEVLIGRIERERGQGEAFAIVRDLDKRTKAKVQALLRRAGRTADTAITVLSDGEDGLRGVVGWFGRNVNIAWTGSMFRDDSSASASNCCTFLDLPSTAAGEVFIRKT